MTGISSMTNPAHSEATSTEEVRGEAAKEWLGLSDSEKIKRFDGMVKATMCHLDGRDLLKELHPRRMLDIKRRVDSVETWYEGDWLTALMYARDGRRA